MWGCILVTGVSSMHHLLVKKLKLIAWIQATGTIILNRQDAFHDLRFTIYDLRFTIYDLRFTIYDLRFTIYDLTI